MISLLELIKVNGLQLCAAVGLVVGIKLGSTITSVMFS